MNSVYIIFFIKILINKEYKMSQANDILDFIKRNCKVEVFIKGLKDGKNLGITALEIQNEYGILRNNASSILNLLCKNGKLVKINSRPVTFIDKEILNEMNKKYNVPIKNIYTFNECSMSGTSLLPNRFMRKRKIILKKERHRGDQAQCL